MICPNINTLHTESKCMDKTVKRGTYQIFHCKRLHRVAARLGRRDGRLGPLGRLADEGLVDELAIRVGPRGLAVGDGLSLLVSLLTSF